MGSVMKVMTLLFEPSEHIFRRSDANASFEGIPPCIR
jgi:hypothetical protein